MRMFSKVTASLSALALSLALSGVALAAAAATGTITGTVKGVEGAKPGKVSVKLLPPGGGKKGEPKAEPKADKPAPGEKKGRPAPIAETTTDDDGKFNLKDVAPGEYRIAAGERGAAMGTERVTVKAGEETKVEITLKAPKAK
ncbi:MAG: hypothetical protein JWO31_1185 [Phycisphaerales bacterium]|nr:hypothetical protein [Phycisphaerales bacterium]